MQHKQKQNNQKANETLTEANAMPENQTQQQVCMSLLFLIQRYLCVCVRVCVCVLFRKIKYNMTKTADWKIGI